MGASDEASCTTVSHTAKISWRLWISIVRTLTSFARGSWTVVFLNDLTHTMTKSSQRRHLKKIQNVSFLFSQNVFLSKTDLHKCCAKNTDWSSLLVALKHWLASTFHRTEFSLKLLISLMLIRVYRRNRHLICRLYLWSIYVLVSCIISIQCKKSWWPVLSKWE